MTHNKRVPDYFPVYKEYQTSNDEMPNIGDIILYYGMDSTIIHVSIYIGESQEKSLIEIEGDQAVGGNGSVKYSEFRMIDPHFKVKLGYCKPSEVVRIIKSLSLMGIINLEDTTNAHKLDETLQKYIDDNS